MFLPEIILANPCAYPLQSNLISADCALTQQLPCQAGIGICLKDNSAGKVCNRPLKQAAFSCRNNKLLVFWAIELLLQWHH